MATHLTVDGSKSFCGPLIEDLQSDTFTNNPNVVDCPNCQDKMHSRPRNLEPGALTYAQGYTAGKDKAYFDLETWRPADHATDCSCRPCRIVRANVRRLFEYWGSGNRTASSD